VSRSASTPPAPPEAAGPAAYEAFEQLYQATIGATTLWLYRLKVSDRDWDDAIQEIYLEAWRVWDTCDSTRGTRGKWLYGITVNVASRCRERRRLKSRR
jgi:DNA-directed RNA polymerase specialized sigma24 family protein